MIKVTRLDGRKLIVNTDLIENIIEADDRYVVRDSPTMLVKRAHYTDSDEVITTNDYCHIVVVEFFAGREAGGNIPATERLGIVGNYLALAAEVVEDR